MTNYNDGLWHGWNGGECPVHPASKVDVALSTGMVSYVSRYEGAGELWWDHSAVRHSKIVAFRVVEKHREPREFWIVAATGDAWETEARAKTAADGLVDGEIIHVREVTE